RRTTPAHAVQIEMRFMEPPFRERCYRWVYEKAMAVPANAPSLIHRSAVVWRERCRAISVPSVPFGASVRPTLETWTNGEKRNGGPFRDPHTVPRETKRLRHCISGCVRHRG